MVRVALVVGLAFYIGIVKQSNGSHLVGYYDNRLAKKLVDLKNLVVCIVLVPDTL